MSVRLGALIVDFRAASFARSCIASLRREWSAAGGASDELEVVVVDNSPREDGRELEHSGARVIRAGQNLGYARGVDLAYERSSKPETLLVCNPDVHFLPGSLARLLATAREAPTLAALAPQASIDPLGAIRLPPIPLPSPTRQLLDAWSQRSRAQAQALADERARAAIAAWTATAPHELEMLSGACFLIRKSAIERIGDLLDPRYPLYFEDADLARRLREASLAFALEPRARIVHHWARSSGTGADFEGEPRARHAVSERAFFERWFGPLGTRALDVAAAAAEAIPPAERCPPIADFADLGERADAPALRWPRRERALVELSMAPHFPLAAGVLVDGEELAFDRRTWEWLFAGRYFARAIERGSLATLAAWTWVKVAPPRADPLELEETARPASPSEAAR